MKADEFVVETKRGKVLDSQAQVSPGAAFTLDRGLDLYRAAAIMGRSPANANDIDPYSFITGLPMIITYTDEEEKMVKAAFKKMGIPYKKHTKRGSKEPDAVNTQSTVKPFKGYPR